jgi:hypothetical protein
MKIIRITSLFSLAMPLTLAAATITGTVTDGTTHKPAAGDDVVLIALTQKMQEVARTKADAKGRYSIQTPDDGMHLIRVDHQKAAYFQPAPPGTTSIDVQVFRAETTPLGLRVTQSYFIKNDSTPPRTQFSPRSYEIYLPEGAQIQGAAAMGPGGMPVSSSPIPLGDPNHYAFVFPLRPGETQFQLSYSLPYSGSLKVMPKLATPVDNLVVILPKSMNFSAGAGSGFQPVDAGQTGQEMNALTWVAKDVSPTHPIAFTISGQGSLPRDVQANQATGQGDASAQPGTPAEGSAAAQADTRPGGGLGNPIDTPGPLDKYKWWILSGLGIALAIAAGFLVRRPAAGSSSAAPGPLVAASTPATDSSPLKESVLASLKEELFALETDRLQGRVTEQEYAEVKGSIETVLRRVLAR